MAPIKKIAKSILLNTAPGIIKNKLFREQKNFCWETLDTIDNEPEVLILEELFKKHPEFIFFDIGANKGEYLFAAEKHLKPSQIKAFEPNPRLTLQLERFFSKIPIYTLALSNENKTAPFKIPTIGGHEDDTLGSLAIEEKLANETSAEVVDVSCIRLDSFLEKHQIQDKLCLKMDVEGFELAVLEGARDTISKHFPLMLIEVEKRHHNGKTVMELINQIQSFAPAGKGYEVFYFDSIIKQIIQVETEPKQNKEDWGSRKYINNFLFIPDDSAYISDINTINNKLSKLFGKAR